ncbi:alanine racemase [Bacilliculturomica massiliensis]|uniref:alanine racemase n=1 Tax=Bacilliculturomica massiliensis TaxID=1917867 RepID=UPI0010317229|nr:alanine racemase [Bacilliculturomica massiliensis]
MGHSQYPILRIDRKALENNGRRMAELCRDRGISACAVVKGVNSLPQCCDILSRCGFTALASSRLEQLRRIKELGAGLPTMLIRIPMLSEVSDLVCFADSSLVSEMKTLRRINEEASAQGKTHRVILMADLGDLREGWFRRQDLLEAALTVEEGLSNVELYGIGTNLSCYGSIVPTVENLGELAEAAEEIETRIGRRLEVISGGATTAVPLMMTGDMPERINHLRLGECLFTRPLSWEQDVEGMDRRAFTIRAEIIELNEKPTFPIGQRGVAAFGKARTYEDRGIRRRAILALGNQDLGDAKNALIPRDGQTFVLGASGDHLIVDIEDCSHLYELGGTMDFGLTYQGLLYASMSPWVNKLYI